MPTVSEGGHGRERAGPGLSTFFLFPMEKGAAGREGGRERAGWKPLLVFHNDYTRTDENDGGERERERAMLVHILTFSSSSFSSRSRSWRRFLP